MIRSRLILPLLALSAFAAAAPPTADTVIRNAEVKAAKEGKNVLVMFHASWCSWCRRFDTLMKSPQFKKSFDDSFVIAGVTVRERDEKRAEENAGWAATMKRYRGAAEQDVPYLVVLSPNGEKLGDSYRPAAGEIPGNGGYPRSKEEIDAFVSLIRRTGRAFSAEQRVALKTYFDLEANPQAVAPNTLAPNEVAEGFKLMFDGKTTAGWHAWKRTNLPPSWRVVDGALTHVRGGGQGGDITTDEEYADFDLRFEWKVNEGGNSGIFYRASPKTDIAWYSGPELQLLDNARHPDGKNPKTSAGSSYAIYAPIQDVTRPAGQWNEMRVVAKGKHIEHWMNGVKVVEYEIESPEWKELVAKSKFASLPDYGRMPSGFIVLQDHGDTVSFRSIRIKRL